MKTSMYFNYTSRSLLRGGQRTILAIFCVAVGVLAVVALQLAGFMLQSSLTSDMRSSNGGDISLNAQSAPLTQQDLTFFDQLKSAGTIHNYTAVIGVTGGLKAATSPLQSFSVEVVDPNDYPLASQPSFVNPSNGSVTNLLSNDKVIVSQNFLDKYHKKVGDTFDIYIKAQAGSGATLHVTLAGVVANQGVFSQAGNLLLISQKDYQTKAPALPAVYSAIYITTTNQTHTDSAVKAINRHFPLVSTQTVADALKAQQSSLDNINYFLEIAGLLALLIGGVGIVNTMQVLLSRRKTEIAMLKTAGYRRVDLYMLFGLEAGLLGLLGGIVGVVAAAAISYGVRDLMQNLGFNVVFALDSWTLASGVVIGFATALIFGLMPIVQAANTRPLNVIREIPENHRASSLALSIFLLLLLSILFCLLSIVILHNDVLLGVEVVYGAFAFLLLLSLFLSLIVLVTSKLPVPERFNLKFLGLILASVAIAALTFVVLPPFGIILFVASFIGLASAFLPRSLKVSTKMALRNIGRRRARTITTMLALFIGVFSIGLVLALGQNLESQISDVFTLKINYNVIAVTTGTDTMTLKKQLGTIPGLSKSTADTFTQLVPVALNDQPLRQTLSTNTDRQTIMNLLSNMEGYDLTQTTPDVQIAQGRNLNASDAGTDNVVIHPQLTGSGSLHMNMKPGDTITVASLDGQTRKTLTVVGVYAGDIFTSHIGNIVATADTVKALSAAKVGVATATYLKIDPAQTDHALDKLGTIVPNATVQNLADIGVGLAQQLNSLLDVLVAVASLSMLAGVLIIANAVALAMLERRRELGILKSVGYTSGTVLSEVMIENGIIGAVGAFLAMLLATGAVRIIGSVLFSLTLDMSSVTAIGLIVGCALLAIVTAVLVAWGSVRVRPLEVLRYE
ncbi:ABC transporter permease [Dictyobacter kobayashii]|uniref:ABC transporter permease n=1 Tax=Dictyobacter kobayashii TaxID=2014872 RepID=A0A402AS61_9CHLR|nr:FtsX-like permease family protein [Dictyobacter kobayashii]GCE21936.1 ABC transporter permease [Dictyobacter kobayashii]